MILGITVRRTNNTENFTLKFTYSDIAGIHKSSVPNVTFKKILQYLHFTINTTLIMGTPNKI